MALLPYISSIVKWIFTPALLLGVLRMLIRPSLVLDWDNTERFNEPTCEKGWGYEQRGQSISVGLRNSGLMQTARSCNVYVEEIKKGARTIFKGRERMAWVGGGFEPRDIRHGKHRGTMASIGHSDSRHAFFALTCKGGAKILGDSGDYSILIVADSPSIWISRAELSMVIRHYPFSADTRVIRAIRRPWYKKIW